MKIRFNSLLTVCVLVLSLLTYPSAAAYAEDYGDCAEIMLMPEDVELYSGYLPELPSYRSNEKSFLFYNQLDKNNKAVYDEMKKLIVPTDEELVVEFPTSLTFTASSAAMSKWTEKEYNEFWEMIFQNIVYGEKAVLLDYPEMFWFKTSPIKLTIGNMRPTLNFLTGKYTIRVTSVKMQVSIKEEYTDLDTAVEFLELLKDAVYDFELDGSDRYQQIKYIHDYICDSVIYDIEAPYRDAAVGVFCEPYRIVCEGYAKAFKLICDKFNIPCVCVPGNIDQATRVGHIWNYVMMEDNKWYAVDCTWDDTDFKDTGIKYDYFLKGSDSFNEKHTNEEGLTYPELSSDDYYYEYPTEEETTEETTAETTVTTVPVQELGDYNKDGQINLADVVLLRRYIVNKTSYDEQIAEIDLNNDGRIDVLDCIVLMRNILGGD